MSDNKIILVSSVTLEPLVTALEEVSQALISSENELMLALNDEVEFITVLYSKLSSYPEIFNIIKPKLILAKSKILNNYKITDNLKLTLNETFNNTTYNGDSIYTK